MKIENLLIIKQMIDIRNVIVKTKWGYDIKDNINVEDINITDICATMNTTIEGDLREVIIEDYYGDLYYYEIDYISSKMSKLLSRIEDFVGIEVVAF